MALATWLNGHGYSHVTADDVILAFNGAVSRSCPAGVVEALERNAHDWHDDPT